MAVYTEEIEVDNLKCHGCANTIIKSLNKLKGVDYVDVAIDTATVKVFCSDHIDRSKVVSILARIGYPEKGSSNNLQRVRSYVSCAVGRLS